MTSYESDCVSCGFPCLGTACPHYRDLVMTCDRCGDEVGTLYYGKKGNQLCTYCALQELEKVIMKREEILTIAKPILFNTEMVRAIQEGRKTVTRRLVKPQHLRVLDSPYRKEHPEVPDNVLIDKLCIPPYQTGDYLYVRETWSQNNGYKEYYYKAGRKSEIPPYNLKWHPSIHMPKEAARIFLRVNDVRVEKLQEIDGKGIISEGIDNGKSNPAMGKRWENMQRMAFENLWDITIKSKDRNKYGWNANPWVWVIEFERARVDE